MLVLVYNLVNTLGGFMLNTLIASEAARAASPPGPPEVQPEAEIIGTLSGTVQTLVNLLSLLLQAFVVSRHLQVCRRSRRTVHPPGHCHHGILGHRAPSGPHRRAVGRRSSRTAQTTRSRTPPVRRSSFQRVARPSTRRSRRSIPSSCALATCCRLAWSSSVFNWP